MRLIDADALKNLPFERMIHTDFGDTAIPIEEIDTAPTVDLTKNQAYDKGFITAMKLYARPKGKWIKVKEERMSIDMSGEIITRYKCSKCGRFIAILPSKLADYPFCHCGADMRKGGPKE